MKKVLKVFKYKGPLIMALFCLTACFKDKQLSVIHLQGETMGTTYNIKYIPNESFPIEKNLVLKNINNILEDFNLVASTYDPNSEISKINLMGAREKHKASTTFAILMKEAVSVNKLSHGVFDPSLSPLINLWGFGPKVRTESLPSEHDVQKALSYCGMINFNFQSGVLEKKNAESELDFSAFAKGYGVDLIVFYLESIQMDDYFVEIGGEIRTRSLKKQWKVGIEMPKAGARGSLSNILILDGAIATSGDYRNFYNYAGKKFSHGINFRSGRPVENTIASVSVFHPTSAMRADAWATALMVSESFADAVDLINKNNLSAFVIHRDKQRLKTYESATWKKEFSND